MRISNRARAARFFEASDSADGRKSSGIPKVFQMFKFPQIWGEWDNTAAELLFPKAKNFLFIGR
jgi:hypothetical protein